MDPRVLRWFGHVGRMYEYHTAGSVLMVDVSGWRIHGRPRLGWMDGVKVSIGNKGMIMEAVKDR